MRGPQPNPAGPSGQEGRVTLPADACAIGHGDVTPHRYSPRQVHVSPGSIEIALAYLLLCQHQEPSHPAAGYGLDLLIADVPSSHALSTP